MGESSKTSIDRRHASSCVSLFLRCKVRRKDGKQHRYWSVVENTRVAGGRVHDGRQLSAYWRR
jgi:hypothetical protein